MADFSACPICNLRVLTSELERWFYFWFFTSYVNCYLFFVSRKLKNWWINTGTLTVTSTMKTLTKTSNWLNKLPLTLPVPLQVHLISRYSFFSSLCKLFCFILYHQSPRFNIPEYQFWCYLTASIEFWSHTGTYLAANH